MDRITTVKVDEVLLKEARIKCITNDISFPRYIGDLIKADLEKDKKEG